MIDHHALRILGDRVMVRRYERPEMHGSIIIPETARTDMSQTLWEFVKVGIGVNLGKKRGRSVPLDMKARPGDILRTRVETGIPIGEGFWLIPSEQVEGVYTW